MKPHLTTLLVAACVLTASACEKFDDVAGPEAGIPAGGALRLADAPAEATLEASGDTYIRDGAPNTSEGASPILRIRASGNNRVLVQFDPEEIEDLIGGGTLVSAILEMDIYENADNWGPVGRPVDLHRLTQGWTEGNGKNADLPGPKQYRGDGPGATWNCSTDAEVANQKPDCEGDDVWEMGKPKMPELHPWVAAPTASIVVTNGLTGEVTFDVTADVAGFLAGDFDHDGWLLRKRDEGPAGKVEFASREYVGEYEDISGPRLVIEYIPAEDGPEGGTLSALKDSFLRSGRANKNEGANPVLNLRADGNHRALLDFGTFSTDGLTGATLVMTIAHNANNWGTTGRTIDAHPLLVDFTEGNGKNLDIAGPQQTDGTGAGVTWNCATDTDVTNSAADCVAQWNGGTYGAATAASFLITNGLSGEVTFDVTADALAGATRWLLRKTSEGAAGEVGFHAREGATALMNPALAPRLILEYGD